MAPASPTSGRWVLLPTVTAFVVVVLVDQLAKAWAVTSLETCASALRPRTVDLCLAYNQGMAFSLGESAGPVIALVAVVIVGVLAASARRIHQVLPRTLMGVVAGGAIGNVIDRALRAPSPGVRGGFLRGAVVDFVYTSFWPTFNVADSCIVVGGILLAVLLWRLPEDVPAAGASVEHPDA